MDRDVGAPAQEHMAESLARAVPRGGELSRKVVATVGACGLGGFHCATGGASPTCHLRCCRVDIPESVSSLCIVGTCGCGCFLWPYWAARLHSALDVNFYKLSFFGLRAPREL